MTALQIATLIVANILAWLVIHIGCAWIGNRIPLDKFDRLSRLFRTHPFERSGAFYERGLRVKAWKELLPDAADWMQGGFHKKRLKGRDPEYLRDFMRETRRAELVHWIAFWAAGLFYFWNPAWVVKWMFLYSAIANLPCIIVQRYNRGRFERIMERNHAVRSR